MKFFTKIVLDSIAVFSFVFFTPHYLYTVNSFSFESPFPATWQKKLVDTAMRAWADVQLLVKNTSLLDEERTLLFDGLLGKLAYFGYCLQQVDVMYDDDRSYLVHILDQIDMQLGTLSTHVLDGCLHNQLSIIKRGLFQANHAGIGASK